MHPIILQVLGWIPDSIVAQNLRDFKFIRELMVGKLLSEWHLDSCEKPVDYDTLCFSSHSLAMHRIAMSTRALLTIFYG